MAVALKRYAEADTCSSTESLKRLRPHETDEEMNIVIVGHVDHGKSTIVGRLLADTDSLPQGKLEQIQSLCRRQNRPFEYAYLVDALKDERAQGITIDAARVFFNSPKRRYIIIDAPGHIEFLKNMVTGAARAEAALLVIDATEGIAENSKRHGTMLAMLGIGQVSVAINKMDLVDYDPRLFHRVVEEYTAFLQSIDVKAAAFIPVSGRQGDNIARRSEATPWYDGPTLLEALDAFTNPPLLVDKPFRMPVQDVYRFTQGGDTRRIVAGTIDSGTLHVGDDVVFYPSQKRSRVKTIEAFNAPPQESVHAGVATGFTLEEQIYIRRGELVARADEAPPHVATRLRANLFWLGKRPMRPGKTYLLKLGTTKVEAHLESISQVLDAATLQRDETKGHIDRHDVAECTLQLATPIACDTIDQIAPTARFVIVDDYEISGGGIVLEPLGAPKEQHVRTNTGEPRERTPGTGISPNRLGLDEILPQLERSPISAQEREQAYGHRPALVLVVGKPTSDPSRLAKAIERRLFDEGCKTYFLGVSEHDQQAPSLVVEYLKDVAPVLLDAGLIVVAGAGVPDPVATDAEIELITSIEPIEPIERAIPADALLTVWIGETGPDRVSTRAVDVTMNLSAGKRSEGAIEPAEAVETVVRLLRDRGVLQPLSR